MYNLIIHLVDTFSGATKKQTVKCNETKLKLFQSIKDNNGTINQFDKQINWTWKIERIEIIN